MERRPNTASQQTKQALAAALVLCQGPESGQSKSVPVQFEQTDFSLPVVSISYQDFETFCNFPPHDEKKREDTFWCVNQQAGQMSNFSAWGTTNEQTL